MTTSSNSWYHGVTRYQWLVLAIASLGWVFDAFDVWPVEQEDLRWRVALKIENIRIAPLFENPYWLEFYAPYEHFADILYTGVSNLLDRHFTTLLKINRVWNMIPVKCIHIIFTV